MRRHLRWLGLGVVLAGAGFIVGCADEPETEDASGAANDMSAAANTQDMRSAGSVDMAAPIVDMGTHD